MPANNETRRNGGFGEKKYSESRFEGKQLKLL